MSTKENRVEVAVYQRAKKGNFHCGDSYYYIETENEFVCAIADGLGSGEFAKESSQIVIDIIKNNIHATVEHIVKQCNEQLFRKRGVVLGILKLTFLSGQYSFSSIGNIGVLTITRDGKRKRNIPNSGYLAGYHRTFKVITDKLEPHMIFLMFSDGVTDADLSQKFILNRDVNDITNTYAHLHSESQNDDTTLIAIRYEG
ncbi:SpoIIE family protein phosphatase [Virgibacillus dakarensis]|uniref:Phosphoserine phosphatase RsbX n=1 Tax=Lentibacillus populi TaxID=1827502 RepID=A0A9W5U0I4_9BACI|nr:MULTISPECIES: SpoIIE family protein phosphatase [Bacillaceae]MBT2218574.1 SpoIIE family protein phosphatase [Virgibacillus dakarensis]MTW88297.1 SpoIIE family protein phosphatase [Virgibacillus dakarensis]GGB55466.1 phosphoserine phosphatase RsbX [Lentibacillus populi]